MRFLHEILGLIKSDPSGYFAKLKRLHNEMATEILKEKELDEETYHKSVCEIKMFWWVFARPILRGYLPKKLFDRTMKFFQSDVIFSSIDDSQYSYEFMQILLESRIEFHENGIQEIGVSSVRNNYFQQLYVLWFEKPFEDVDDISEFNMLDFNVFDKFNEQVDTQRIYTILAPAYTKSLKKIIN